MQVWEVLDVLFRFLLFSARTARAMLQLLDNPPYGKRWRLYILPQYLANITEPLAHIESYILAKFIPVPAKLCMQGFEVFRPFLCVFMSGFRIFVR